LKDHAERTIPGDMFEKRSERWPEDTPDTKEAYYLRDLFDSEIAWYSPSACSFTHILLQVCSCRKLLRRQLFGAHNMFSEPVPLLTVPYRWIPREDWGCAADPSGRSVSIHNAAYE